MNKILFSFLFLSVCFSFEIEEKLSITELKEEAELFILNQSYIDAIANYEKIYDILLLIFGEEHKNLSETLITLGDLYYKINDEINALRCFQKAIHIMHYNSNFCWCFCIRLGCWSDISNLAFNESKLFS